MKPNQRFIAGAVCPKCEAMDSLLLNMLDQSIECVDCGYQQTELERDNDKATQQAKQQADQPIVNKVLPKKVNVSSVIRVTNLDK